MSEREWEPIFYFIHNRSMDLFWNDPIPYGRISIIEVKTSNYSKMFSNMFFKSK